MILKGKKALKDFIVVSNNSEMHTFCIQLSKCPEDCI